MRKFILSLLIFFCGVCIIFGQDEKKTDLNNSIINLKNGNIVKGKIIETADEYIVVMLNNPQGELKIKYDEILYLNKMDAQKIKKAYAKTKEIVKEIPQIRNLDYQFSIEKKIMTETQGLNVVNREFKEEYSDAMLVGIEKTYVLLDLLPRGFNYKDSITQFFSDQVGGFYDPQDKYLAIIIGGSAEKEYNNTLNATGLGNLQVLSYQVQVLVHELTHAMQDQNFNISELINLADNEDEKMAIMSLLEGEASYVEFDYTIDKMLDAAIKGEIPTLKLPDNISKEQKQQFKKQIFQIMLNATTMNPNATSLTIGEKTNKYKKFPPFITQTLTFPYLSGLNFIKKVKDAGGWEMVDKLYRDPPLSTEQIIHPEKFLKKRDFPVEIILPVQDISDVLTRQTLIYDNTLGEYTIYWVIKSTLDEDTARKASEGWDGDEILTFESGSGNLVNVWYTLWDDEKEAEEFYLAYKQILKKKNKGANIEKTKEGVVYHKKENGIVYIEQEQNKVIIMNGINASDKDALRKYIQKTKTKELGGDILIHVGD